MRIVRTQLIAWRRVSSLTYLYFSRVFLVANSSLLVRMSSLLFDLLCDTLLRVLGELLCEIWQEFYIKDFLGCVPLLYILCYGLVEFSDRFAHDVAPLGVNLI